MLCVNSRTGSSAHPFQRICNSLISETVDTLQYADHTHKGTLKMVLLLVLSFPGNNIMKKPLICKLQKEERKMEFKMSKCFTFVQKHWQTRSFYSGTFKISKKLEKTCGELLRMTAHHRRVGYFIAILWRALQWVAFYQIRLVKWNWIELRWLAFICTM